MKISRFPLSCLMLFVLLSNTAKSHEIGLQLYSLRNQMNEDLPASVAKINEWGIKVVEGGGALYDHSLLDFKSLLEKNSIELVSVDADYNELRDNPIAVAYKAKYFGATSATCYWIPHTGAFSIEDAKKAVDVINKAGKLLAQNGIQLQYHPHGYEFIAYGDGNILDYMMENVEYATFQMDVFWVKQAGLDPTKLLQKYPGRFTSLHLKDRKNGTPNSTDGKADTEANVILGAGDVGIESVYAEAKKQGIRYFFIEDESSRVIQQVPASLAYLKELDNKR